MCKVNISQTSYFYNPSCPSSSLHQSPSPQFISFLASPQILKSVQQGILTVGSGCGGKLSHSIPIAQNAHTTKQHFEVKRPESPPSLQSGPATFLGVPASVMRRFPDPSGGKNPVPWSPASSGNRRLEKNSSVVSFPCRDSQTDKDLMKRKDAKTLTG